MRQMSTKIKRNKQRRAQRIVRILVRIVVRVQQLLLLSLFCL